MTASKFIPPGFPIGFHPVANLFPLLEGDEFDALVADIRDNGVRNEIWTHKGQIIDGRNRYRACHKLGIGCLANEWDGEGSLVAFVLSLNLHRRHLTSGQKAALAVEVLPMIEQEAKERQREAGGDKRSEKVRQKFHCPECGKEFDREVWHCGTCDHHWQMHVDECRNCHQETRPEGETVQEIFPDPVPQARDEAAKLTGTNPRYVSDAKKLKDEAPEVFDKVRSGELTIPQAKQEVQAAKKAEERKAIAAEAAAAAPPGDDQNILAGDFRDLVDDIETASVDLVFTDPPYHREYLSLYGDLAAAAARVLKPGGSLVCYLGQYQIHEVCNLVTPHLRLWWTLCCLHTGRSARMTEYGIVVRWKPMLWFVKGTRSDKHTFVDDLIESAEEKTHHDWQQSEIEAAYYVEKLCPPGGLVFDPFCGGGTTPAVCKKLGRRWLSCDTDDAAVHLARKRVRDASQD